MDKLKLGKKGEELAVKFLQKQGLKILARNYKTPQGELDIIAKNPKEIIFIEVKTRTSQEFGKPAEAVNYRKQEKLKLLAQEYLCTNKLENSNLRFDVLAIVIRPQGKPKIEWLQGAI